jgi:dihydroorotase
MPHIDPRPLLIHNALLMDPAMGREEAGGILVQDGVIRALGRGLDAASGPEGTLRLDAGQRVVAPGLVDARVFIGEPGEEHRETLRTAGEAAAAGGVTTIICMPETSPPLDDTPSIDFILRRARDRAAVRVHPMAAITKGLAGREMSEIGLLLEAGAVAFTDGARSVMNAQVMRRALTYARPFDALIVHHAEDRDLVGNGVMAQGTFASRLGLPGVPVEAETVILERDMRLVRLTGGRYHASLVSTADSVEIIRAAKRAGLPVTAGVSVNHLSFNENDVGRYRTFYKLAPPLRDEAQRQALVAGLADGTIDIVVSDHNPQDVETKRQPFAEAAHGAIGLETMLPAMMRLVNAGALTLMQVLRLLSTRPADLLRLPGGRLAPGAPGDVIVFDPEEPWVVDPAKLRSRAKNTPFDGARLQGKVLLTVVGGRIVHRELP